jgi:hypothetical protein
MSKSDRSDHFVQSEQSRVIFAWVNTVSIPVGAKIRKPIFIFHRCDALITAWAVGLIKELDLKDATRVLLIPSALPAAATSHSARIPAASTGATET